MLRGSAISTVRPVSASMLATVIESGRRPQRPAPESPPASSTLKRPSWAPVTVPSPNIASTKSRCTPTMCAPKSRVPATERQSTPFTPTTARRWPRCRLSGWPMRQASTKSAAQPTAASIRTRRSRREQPGAEGELEDQAVPDQADQQGQHEDRGEAEPDAQRDPADLALPATSWAEPGRARVITMSAMARRKRTRAARSPALLRGP